MLTRGVVALLRARLRQYPAAALVGPRQCGKTTLARSLGGDYFDLEQQADRVRLDVEWDRRIAGRRLLILDEAQTWPELFPRLRGAIDARRTKKGRFLLLGSVAPSLMTHVSESLAGRLSLVELTPFLLGELTSPPTRARLWSCGGFPEGGVLKPGRFPQWQHDYLALLTQRDLPNWGLTARPAMTLRLLRMLAALHGQVWNASQVGGSLGLSYHTVNSYLDYLEGAFLIRRLPPFVSNLSKRIIRSPKVYWRDSGLLHAIMNVSAPRQLPDQPWIGASWEGFVIEQILGTLGAAGAAAEPFFLRTSDQHEIDLVLRIGTVLWAIEIKLSSQPTPADLKRLNHTADLIGAGRRILISATRDCVDDGVCASVNLEWMLDHLRRSPRRRGRGKRGG